MKIDTTPNKQTVAHPFFTGKKYCFCYCDGSTTVGDPYGYENHYDWENAPTVLWTEKELKAFLPNSTVHAFRLSMEEGMKEEIARLTKSKRGAETAHIPRVGLDKTPINLKKRMEERIAFLKANRIDFVEITFVKEKEGTAKYYQD